MDEYWITQWVRWPSAITTVEPPLRLTRCLVRQGRVVAMYAVGVFVKKSGGGF